MESIISIGKDHRCLFSPEWLCQGRQLWPRESLLRGAGQCGADDQDLVAPAVWPSAVLDSMLLHDSQRGRVQIIESLPVQALGVCTLEVLTQEV